MFIACVLPSTALLFAKKTATSSVPGSNSRDVTNPFVLCFHEVHGCVCKASLHCQRVWFPWPSALLSGVVCCRSPIAMAYLPLLVSVPSLYVGIMPSWGLCV